MYHLSLLSLTLVFVSVNGAALNAMHHSWAPSVPSMYWTPQRLNASASTKDLSTHARLHKEQPRSYPPPVSNRPRPRQVSNSSSTPTPTAAILLDTRPTPEPTGDPSQSTTVHIANTRDFSLILPKEGGELISDAEADGVSFCTPNSAAPDCVRNFPEGFITAAAYEASDDGAYVQVTGCLDPTKFHIDPSDAGGQFDVRYPNGAQCTFGGYGASFIELVEPGTNRFCIRCCSSSGDQVNCNSHQDRMGCINAIPGVYEFPDLGISCN